MILTATLEVTKEGVKFPSIEQLRHVLKEMEYHGIQRRQFRGTVKVHGTNARMEFLPDGSIIVGGRNQHNLADGYMGWAEFAHSIKDQMPRMSGIHYTVYGEWAGNGIQGGIPYPKQWFIFAIYDHDNDSWIEDVFLKGYGHLPERVHYISDFGVFYATVEPENERLMEYMLDNIQEMVDAIDEECPVAKALGYPGVHGEGVVFVPVYGNGKPFALNPAHGFKVKGTRHQTTKVRKEQMTVEGLEEFLAATVTEARLMQGLEHVTLDKRNTGDFVKWVQQDIEKEDADLLEGEGLKIALKRAGNMAATWFLKKLDGQ